MNANLVRTGPPDNPRGWALIGEDGSTEGSSPRRQDAVDEAVRRVEDGQYTHINNQPVKTEAEVRLACK